MKHAKGFLFALLPLSAVLLAGCPLQQVDPSSVNQSEPVEEKKTALNIVREEGANFTFTPSLPLVEFEDKPNSYYLEGGLTNSSLNHHSGEAFFVEAKPDGSPDRAEARPIDGDPLVPGTQDIYLFAKATIELPEGEDVYFDAEHSGATPSGSPLIAKAIRVAFYSEESAFVYAPLQEAAKCSYIQNTALEIGQYGDELFDQSSTNKVKLPAKTTTMVVWFDGNDENMLTENYTGADSVELTLAFA